MVDTEKNLPLSNTALQRKKSLVRPERSRSVKRNYVVGGLRKGLPQETLDIFNKHMSNPPSQPVLKDDGPQQTYWVIVARAMTCCLPPLFLKHVLRKKDSYVQQAFREKLALCMIILILMGAVGFLTFGFSQTLCGIPPTRFKYTDFPNRKEAFAVKGRAYSTRKAPAPDTGGKDLSMLYSPATNGPCSAFFSQSPLPCELNGQNSSCQSSSSISQLEYIGDVFLDWPDVYAGTVSTLPNSRIVVYNSAILDISLYSQHQTIVGQDTYNLVSPLVGQDITATMMHAGKIREAMCLQDLFQFAVIEQKTLGCVVTDVVLYVSLCFIVGVVLIKFILAVFFLYAVGWKLGRSKKISKPQKALPEQPRSQQISDNRPPSTYSDFGEQQNLAFMNFKEGSTLQDPVTDPNLMHTLIMVPCYSEGYESLRLTLDSVAETDYPATHKTIFVIADGMVQGAENEKPTYQYIIDMMEIDSRFKEEDPKRGGEPCSYSYVAIADGSNRKNFAKVYAGWYRYHEKNQKRKKDDIDDEQVKLDRTGTLRTLRNRKRGKIPIILVVKVGNDEEREKKAAKPGNRGKRDSQVILMNFLTKVIFDERMTSLEFDIFFKLWTITGVHPEKYESVLMVDADTKVYRDSLSKMVACMVEDPDVIGLCGETRVQNKWQSWVTMIQVFEYYISHHLSKSFESVFGCVTCLPGCFSMYRIKTPIGSNGFSVPILANPDIVEEYAEYVVDTLHKKNLLLLGEDRYLSTLMLRTFTKRKMLFVPSAVCTTFVPDSFKVLVSQRRRWINSTIHNLLELVKVRELCGAFCFSMQFVIFMELVGTVVLPAAICFTFYVVGISFTAKELPIIPLSLLAAILGLPAVLIVSTAHHIIYVFWMLIYLIALPIWNFMLPLYAFWHMDDFSWGATRKTEGDSKNEDHGRRRGEFDGTDIAMKTWLEWMEQRKNDLKKIAVPKPNKRIFGTDTTMSSSSSSISSFGSNGSNNFRVVSSTGTTWTDGRSRQNSNVRFDAPFYSTASSVVDSRSIPHPFAQQRIVHPSMRNDSQ